MYKIICLTTVSALLFTGCATHSPDKVSDKNSQKVATITQAVGEHLLDGKTINWVYNNSGGGMVLSFENGLAEYEWVTGPRKGRTAQDIPYKSRIIGDEVYLINWVQPEKPDFITLIFDFKTNVVFSSGLIGYGTDRQKNLFLDGVIDSVEK